MTDDQIQEAAGFYGIDLTETHRRVAVMIEQADKPDDPICIGCAKRPDEIPEYVDMASTIEDMTPKEFVLEEEGTLNTTNGHFMCTDCYIKNGQPSKPFPDRWVAP